MTHDRFSHVINALDDLLDEEKSALLKGDLDHVARLLDRKESLIEELSALEAGEAQSLDRLSTRIRGNQALLNSALDGIRSVAKRLSELRRVRRSLDTYDEKGARRTVDISGDKSVEKRA